MTGGLVLSGIFCVSFALMAARSPAQPASGAVAPGTGAPQTTEQTPVPRFRSSVEVVSVAAVVRDRRGRLVKDLEKKDFEIVEAGERRPIIDFRAEVNGPVKVAVLLDISGSMRVGQRTDDARQAASHIFSSLAGKDQAAVFTFDTALAQAQSFTSSRQKLEDAIESAEKPFGQTSLYDAIARTARTVAVASASGPKGIPQRSAVVVITDGIDTKSNLKPADVSVVASSIDVPVYIVAVMATVDDPRETNHERSVAVASDLQELARGTGGELFIASAPAHASVAARQMVSELRHQYVLAFKASSHAGWRPLEVRTRQGSLIVRARTGYSGVARSSSEEAAPAAKSRTSQRPAYIGR
ncbi:MAG: VWA domain-containing protein [Vicinamibacterales bacterium]